MADLESLVARPAEGVATRTDEPAVDLAGRLRLTTYPPYIAHLGYDPERRVADVQAGYCEGAARASTVMHDYGARYVISSGGLLPCSTPTDFSASPDFETVYNGEGVQIWRLIR